MEVRKNIWTFKQLVHVGVYLVMLYLFSPLTVAAQLYTIKNGKMYIEVNKDISPAALDSFIIQYGLSDLAIKYFLRTNSQDSFKFLGWNLNKNDERSFSIIKPLVSADDLTSLAEKMIIAENEPGVSALFPATNNGLFYGSNKFKNKNPFASSDSLVTFYLRKRNNANKVMLAGSFNNWSPESLPMTKTDSGWIATVKLGPGKYWYKFIVDGNWMVDEDNLQRENDGQGNINAVYYKTNYVFTLNGYTDAKKVYLSGSFNNWQPKDLLMTRTATGWELPVYLANGTHTYKYIVDDEWIIDPTNPERLPNEFDDYNSVIRLGKPFIFKLYGYKDAKTVLLTGSFNGWRKDELYMNPTATGWEIPYTLGPGNYEYRFIVDGKEITDPGNPIFTNENRKQGNSFLILDPNYTFRLKGFPNAKSVFLGGDFNNFSSNSLAMKRVGDEWVFPIHLSRGKHLYKFVVDGQWIKDPDNKLWEQNKYKTGDSVLWIED